MYSYVCICINIHNIAIVIIIVAAYLSFYYAFLTCMQICDYRSVATYNCVYKLCIYLYVMIHVCIIHVKAFLTRGKIDRACGNGFTVRGLGLSSLLLAAAAAVLL